ncbi:MAG: hypothetical protein AABZ60_12825 [Planctomycetota bacterium]
MAKMNVQWRSMETLQIVEKVKSVTSGEQTASAEEISYSANSLQALLEENKKPVLVWAYNPEEKDLVKKIEEMFSVEKMAVTCKFFTCIKIPISGLDLKAETILIYSLEGELVGSLTDKITQNKLFGLMSVIIQKTFKNPVLPQFLSSYTKLFNEIDRLIGQQGILQEKKARLEEKGKQAEIAQVEKELNGLEEKLAQLNTQEKELLNFELFAKKTKS